MDSQEAPLSFQNSLKVFLGVGEWKPEWKKELIEVLNRTQKGLPVSVVVVVSKESDLYSEVLFLLSFAGLTLGLICGYLAQQFLGIVDVLTFPIFGFSLGSTLFVFRRFFISKIAPRAIRERVSARAKAIFFDHDQRLQGKLVVLYVSEMEREVWFLVSPTLVSKTPPEDIRKILSKLVAQYDSRSPMKELSPALVSLGKILKSSYGVAEGGEVESVPPFVGSAVSQLPSDRNFLLPVPVLKGNKDIN
jgi:hypothetical protein